MTIIVSLGEPQETSWQAKGVIGVVVLQEASQLAASEEAREAISLGQIHQHLNVPSLPDTVRVTVWAAVEEAARRVADHPPDEWPSNWVAHVGDLAEEMAARREDPSRPGRWPNPA